MPTHKRFCLNPTFLLFILLLAVTSVANAQEAVLIKEEVLTKEEMIADLDRLAVQLVEIHPGLEFYESTKQLPSLIASVRNSLPDQATPIEFLLHIAPIIDATKCGHTGFNIKTRKKTKGLFAKDIPALFPLQLKLVEGVAFVDRNLSTDTLLVKDKMELLSIDGRPMEELLLELSAINLGSDGNNRLGEIHFITKYFMLAYKMFYGEKENFTVEVRDLHNNKITKATIPSASLKEMRSIRAERYSPSGLGSIQFRKIEGVDHVAVVDVNTFSSPRFDFLQIGYTLKLRKIFKLIDEGNYEYLILDLRNNPGGVVDNVVRLMKYTFNEPFVMANEVSLNRQYFKSDVGFFKKAGIFLRRKTKTADKYILKGYSGKKYRVKKRNRFKGKMIVLIDEGSFSAACTYALLAKSRNRAILLGEEAGGSYHIVSAGDSHDCKLKNADLTVRIPIMLFEYNVAADRQSKLNGVVPNIVKHISVSDYLQGVDTQLAAAVGLIEVERGRELFRD